MFVSSLGSSLSRVCLEFVEFGVEFVSSFKKNTQQKWHQNSSGLMRIKSEHFLQGVLSTRMQVQSMYSE